MINHKENFNLSKKVTYFDNAATTLKPNIVIEELSNYYNNLSTNVNRSNHGLASITNKLFEDTRENLRGFINAGDTSEIIFTSGTTEGINLLVNGFFKELLQDGDEVLITKAEHASNVLPWFNLINNNGIKVRFINILDDLTLDIESIKSMITNKTKVISIAHITNTIGDIRDLKTICDIAHEKGIIVLVDGAQALSHTSVDVSEIDVDFYVGSGHKMFGPTGTGFIYGKKELLNEVTPQILGGGNNLSFTNEMYFVLKELPYRLEAGTPNIAGIIGLNAAINYLKDINIEEVEAYERELKKYCLDKLKEIPEVILYNENVPGSIILFNIDDIFCEDVENYLAKHDVIIRAGNHCAKLTNNIIKASNTCRISFSIYNNKEEIDGVVALLRNNKNIFNEIL